LLPTLNLWFLAAGYSVILAFFIIQRLLRRTKVARSLKGGVYDRWNMILIGSATGIGLWVPIIADVLGPGVLPISIPLALGALALMVLGVGVRVWAAVTLGSYYTTTLTMTEGQKVVTAGPYGWVRHPGYLGEILIWTGFGVLSSNLIAVVWLPVMFVAVLLYRISSEEKMLVKELGDDYVQYQQRTRRLVPLVY
jgi:protein-S-isoprenylcysteine O-methyltransferase Ste14